MFSAIRHTTQTTESQALETKREGTKHCQHKAEVDASQSGMEKCGTAHG